MATPKQKKAARKNIKKARAVQSERAGGKRVKKANGGLSTSKKNRLPKSSFAFPTERKEPLTDARHVRNAIARFDQVEGVTDAERDKAWKRVRAAAKNYGVEVTEKSWRELFKGARAKKVKSKKSGSGGATADPADEA
jgi:hypothetical protein